MQHLRWDCPPLQFQANGWKSKFAPEDLVRDEHWTEAQMHNTWIESRQVVMFAISLSQGAWQLVAAWVDLRSD